MLPMTSSVTSSFSLAQMATLLLTRCHPQTSTDSVLAGVSSSSDTSTPSSSLSSSPSPSSSPSSSSSSSSSTTSVVFLYKLIGNVMNSEYLLTRSSIRSCFKNSSASSFKNIVISVPLSKVLPLGSLVIENEESAVDSQICCSSSGDLEVTLTLSATR